jgi:hypothetical protein
MPIGKDNTCLESYLTAYQVNTLHGKADSHIILPRINAIIAQRPDFDVSFFPLCSFHSHLGLGF